MRKVIVEDGTRVTFIPLAMWERIPIVRAFAIGDTAVTGDATDVWTADEPNPHRDVHTWGQIHEADEGVRWCRGWEGEAADALRAGAALACPAGQMLYDPVTEEQARAHYVATRTSR